MKKLLLITEGFYHYDNAIKEAIERENYCVTKFQAHVTLNNIQGLMYRKNVKAYRQKKQKKLQAALLTEELYDIVLVICGHSLDVETFLQFRKKQTKAEFILYLWDDIKRINTYEAIKYCFHRIITFDRHDAQKYDLEFRPLFYLDSYSYSNQEKKYDVCFMGWLHSDRKLVIRKIIQKYFVNEEKVFLYLFTGPLSILKSKCSAKTRWEKQITHSMHTKRLPEADAKEILLQSKATLDIQHVTQKGLTIRTFESLAAHTKLITSNEEVQYYDFYRKSNVIIIDRENPVIDQSVLELPWEEVDEAIVKKYSLETWVKDILKDEREI